MQDIIRTSLRLPKDLHEKIEIAAKGRPMHGEIINRLYASLVGVRTSKEKFIKTPWGIEVKI